MNKTINFIDKKAVIGKSVKIEPFTFIDKNVTIGDNCSIGNNVTIYHGVTLGGISPAIKASEQVGLKRHPTLEDDVIVGSGAQILGPVVIGKNAKIGANAVVTKNVPENAIMVGIPAKNVGESSVDDETFKPYGITEQSDKN